MDTTKRQPEFLTSLITEELLGSKYARLRFPFVYYSRCLGRKLIVPTGFICDYESVPLLKASSKRAGVLHDYVCRTDSDPVLTKALAAELYNEAQALRDKLFYDARPYLRFNRARRFFRAILRGVKTSTVRIVPGYFHKHAVTATLEEISRG